MSYEDTLRRLGETTSNSVAAIFDQWQRGEITQKTAAGLIETVVLVAKQQGANFGVLSFQAFMKTTTGTAAKFAADTVALSGGEKKAMQIAINVAMRKSLEDMPLALQLLSFNAPVNATNESFRRAMKRDSRADGYSRGLEGSACELCQWLYKDGYVYPVNKPMYRHPGCVCSQVPVIRNN